MRAKLERSCEVCEYRRVSEDDEAHTIQFTVNLFPKSIQDILS